MSDELNRINPTVVEGAEDIHGAEGHDAEMYSPMMQNRFAFRDAMRRSRDTLTEKQVGDLMRMRRFGRGSYGAESKFDELSDEIAEQYEKKGMSKEEAEKIGDATAYKVGVAKFGKKGMEKKAKVGMDKKKMKAHEAEGLGNILGNVIPEPHFMGIDEIIREKNKNQNMKDAQGYDDKLDESMGMSNRESSMKQSMKDRRDESKGMEKGMGRRAYRRVKTMDMDAQGYDDRHLTRDILSTMDALAILRNRLMEMEGKEIDEIIRNGWGRWGMIKVGDTYAPLSMTPENIHSIITSLNEQYLRYSAESFEANEEAVEQTDANMVNEGSVDAFYGSGAKVDTSSIELQPIANPSVDEAFDVGNDVGIDVAEQEVMNINPSVEVNYGAMSDNFEAEILQKVGLKEGSNLNSPNMDSLSYMRLDIYPQKTNKEKYVLLVRPYHISKVSEKYLNDILTSEHKPFPYGSKYSWPNEQNRNGLIWDDEIKGLRRMKTQEKEIFDNNEVMMKKAIKKLEKKIKNINKPNDEGDIVDTTQDLLAKGGVRVGGMTASAIVLGIAGLSGYYYARR